MKITIRLHEDILERFGAEADKYGGTVRSQTLINFVLREYLDGKAPNFEDALRRVIREELRCAA